jgi:hypothetical protein
MTYNHDRDPDLPGRRSTARLSAAMIWMLILVGAFIIAGLAAYSTRDNTSQSTMTAPPSGQSSTTGQSSDRPAPSR